MIRKVCNYLVFNENDRILDLACGKGRHAIYLNQAGFNVVGVDLSVKNIEYARRYENERLRFYVHDMREVFRQCNFDYVLNLFTSFGYFSTQKEDEKVICAVSKVLNRNGKFLLDFLNPYTVIHSLVNSEIKTIEGITFRINRNFQEGFIIKDIQFSDKGKSFNFQERVKAIRRTEFLSYFEKAGLKLIKIFGDYELNDYHAETSERMIFLLQK